MLNGNKNDSQIVKYSDLLEAFSDLQEGDSSNITLNHNNLLNESSFCNTGVEDVHID